MPQSVSLNNLNPELRQRTELLLAACPTLWVGSAFRTLAQQQRLYDLWLAGKGSPANRPGTSMHEKGLAVDVDCYPADFDARAKLAKQFGLYQPHLPVEPWHLEMSPTRKPLDTTQGSTMPKRVDACPVPGATNGAHWVLTDDGGVRANRGAPFYGSYPGLTENEKQGKRSFIAISPSAHGGYIVYGDDDSYYEFGPK